MQDSPIVPTDRFWAKVDANAHSWHPLTAHSADVAAVVQRLLQPDSPFRAGVARSLGMTDLSDAVIAFIVYLSALHDIGKVNHGFQRKAGRAPSGRAALGSTGHVKILLDSWHLPALRAPMSELVEPWQHDHVAVLELLGATIAHHGRPWDSSPVSTHANLWAPSGERNPVSHIRELISLARQWSGIDLMTAPPFDTTPLFTHLYAGILTLADWIGSTEYAFPFAPDAAADPLAYWETAEERADYGCRRIGVVPGTTLAPINAATLYRLISPETFASSTPTPLQQYVAQMPLPSPGARILFESETGSGKTEAALALYARLRAAGQVGGLMFALPSRATAYAMHERVSSALSNLYTGAIRPTVALAVGGLELDARAEVTALSDETHLYPDEADRQLVRWSTLGSKRFLAAEVVVGTLDQVLLASLPVRHAHMRMAALSRHLLVIDEVHAYDRYMNAIMARAVTTHSALGGVTLFMSATLAERARQDLSGSRPDPLPREVAVTRPLPAVCVRESTDACWSDQSIAQTDSEQRAKQIRWSVIEEEQCLAHAIDAARAGARVCILRNTVRDARATIDDLAAIGATDLLWRPTNSMFTPAYHARYTAMDRRALDIDVRAHFGRGGNAGASILVATQVVEQSLDVDFDYLVTDLAPIDVLLQRVGRVHRHNERVRPLGYAAVANIAVVSPADGFSTILRQRQVPSGWGSVYRDLGFLELTLRTLRTRGQSEIPRDNRPLIEDVFSPEAYEHLRDESEQWREYLQEQEGEALAASTHGAMLALNCTGRQTYRELAAVFALADERKIRTRLGDDRVRIDLPHPVANRYASGVTRYVDLPVQIVGDQQETTLVEKWEDTGEITRFKIGEWNVAYDNLGWAWKKITQA